MILKKLNVTLEITIIKESNINKKVRKPKMNSTQISRKNRSVQHVRTLKYPVLDKYSGS